MAQHKYAEVEAYYQASKSTYEVEAVERAYQELVAAAAKRGMTSEQMVAVLAPQVAKATPEQLGLVRVQAAKRYIDANS